MSHLYLIKILSILKGNVNFGIDKITYKKSISASMINFNEQSSYRKKIKFYVNKTSNP